MADLRGKDPLERAELIVARCAHPDYRPILSEYLQLAEKGTCPSRWTSRSRFTAISARPAT